MELALFLIITGAAGAYFTSISCRRAHARHRPPSWRYAWLATLVTVILSVLSICQGDLFHPGRWNSGKIPLWFTVAIVSVATSVPALVASAVVLEIYWRKFRHERSDS